MDTTKFNHLTPEEYKKQTQANWTQAPCGSNYGIAEFGSKEYFDQVEEHRYRTHPWIIKAIDSFDINGKDVLEIGFGMGTDHLNLARRGARMHGIDLTPRNLEVTSQRFKIYGQQSQLITGDAEYLLFQDNSMDFIYSFGVIHHSPDTNRIISEIHRVLKPGGKCWVTVYHKNSVFFWWNTFIINYLLRGGWRKRNIKQQISLIEYPNTNENMVIRLYRRKEFKALFRSFSSSRCSVKQLVPADLGWFSCFYSDPCSPTPFLNFVGKRFGWYVIIEAVK